MQTAQHVKSNSCLKTPLRKGLLALGTLSTLVILHWVMTQLYVCMCAPTGLTGILYTAMGMGSPLCSFLITIQQRTAELYTAIWIAMALTMWNFGSVFYQLATSTTINTTTTTPIAATSAMKT